MIICADDYGLREDIDRAILGLCSLGKLSAVSCMVVLKRCDATALHGLLAHQATEIVGGADAPMRSATRSPGSPGQPMPWSVVLKTT